MIPDIIAGIYEHGIAPTAALICSALYVQQSVQEKTRDKQLEIKEKTDDERFIRNIELLEKLLLGQKETLDQIRSLASNTVTLADLSRDLSGDLHELGGLINSLVTDVKLLASNQLTLTAGFQKVIEQLIAALRD